MVSYSIFYTKNAIKDIVKLKASGLDKKTQLLIEVIKENPFQSPPSYEKLQGSLSGLYSRRINIQHRIIYQVYETEKSIKIISLWSHYEEYKGR